MSNRISLDMEDMEQVTGGSLYCNTVDGVKVLERLDAEHNVIETWRILTTKNDVYNELKTKYFTLEGNKDLVMIDILLSEGKIGPM